MKRLIFVGVTCTAILAFALPTPGQTTDKSFPATVEQYFAVWVGERDGRLTAARVDDLLRDPRVKDDQAAALVAVHQYQRHHRADGKQDYPAVTLNFLRTATAPDFAEKFAKARERMAAPRALFVEPLPGLEGLKQGPLGDCFFASPLAARRRGGA